MIKTFEQYHELDPYGEEDWNYEPDRVYDVNKDKWEKFVNFCKLKNYKWGSCKCFPVLEEWEEFDWGDGVYIFVENGILSYLNYKDKRYLIDNSYNIEEIIKFE